MTKLPRVRNRLHLLIFGGATLYASFLAASAILSMKLDVMLILAVPVIAIWFFMAGVGIWAGLAALQSIRLDSEALYVCVGPIVLRKISLARIQTVGVSRMPLTTRAIWHPEDCKRVLVLSFMTADELTQKGEKFLQNPETRRKMEKDALSTTDSLAPARAFVMQKPLIHALWLQDSPKAETALREHLTDTVFLL